MTAKDVSVGLTYKVLVSDSIVNVRLTRVCPYGGWYGTNLDTGQSVRIKTAGRLREQVVVNSDHRSQADSGKITASKENSNMSKTAKPAKQSAADRRARRTPAAPTNAPISASERLDMANVKSPANGRTTTKPAAAKPSPKPQAAKPAATTPRNANGTVKPKPAAAKPAATKPKPAVLKVSDSGAKQIEAATNGKVKAADVKQAVVKQTAKPKPAAAKRAAKSTAHDEALDIDKLAAQIAAKLIAETTTKTVQEDTKMATTKRKISGKNKPAVKSNVTSKPAAAKRTIKRTATVTAPQSVTVNDDGSVTVLLTALKETPGKYQFGQDKSDVNPLISGFYVTKAGIEALNEAGDDAVLELTYGPHDGEQPKNSLRFTEVTGNDSPASSLYLMRNAAKALFSGISTNDTIMADMRIVSDSSVSLTVWVDNG